MINHLIITRRVTSTFLAALPDNVTEFSAYLYAVVSRSPQAIVKDHKFGLQARIDPCYFDWTTKSITMYLPQNINPGINSLDDLDPTFYDGIEAAFIALILSSIP
jgi:hypothetical protein